MRRRRVLIVLVALLAVGAGTWAAVRYLPFGLTDAERYFDPVGERELQPDELGQLENVLTEYQLLSATGDEFPGWNRAQRASWKYTIAFAAYGLPSAMMIAPEKKGLFDQLFFMMIQKMKSRLVWGDFTEWGFGKDPISFQNIMYKGHLNLMFGLYQLTTGDRRYAREYTWLTRQIVDEMRLHHGGGVYEGTTCEPDHWFVECNTIGILSLYVYDRLFGTSYTEHESAWTLDFFQKRMVDPETGLFYRQYNPTLDHVDQRLLGYNNAWVITFLRPVRPEWSERLYPVWKEVFVHEYGPYATVDGARGGDPDPIAHLFGMWASKEMGDVDLFRKLRNGMDQLVGLEKPREPGRGGLTYAMDDAIQLNGPALATKLHVGWLRVFAHDWGPTQTLEPPDVSDMAWTDLLPTEVYDLDPERPLPEPVEGRPCPNCLWGDPDAAAGTRPASPDGSS